ncbi:MAG: carboxynorspermidine decarboxylase [Opitutales bacterium]
MAITQPFELPEDWSGLDFAQLPSPAFVVHADRLEANARLLADIRELADVRILLALKGFAMYETFPTLSQYLDGTTSSGLHEALLAQEFFGREIHVYSPAFKPEEIQSLIGFADHLVFNSPGQWMRYRENVQNAGRRIDCGLRINPGYSEVELALYNPCAPKSRLGTPLDWFEQELMRHGTNWLKGLSGLHFHTLCEQNVGALARTLPEFEKRFSKYFTGLEWVNLGGGHHITRPDYDRAALVALLKDFRERHGLTVYLEPGEAIALDTGILVATVMDIIDNDGLVAVLDTSATTHMPDTLEMPYRAHIYGAGQPGEHPHTYRLGGLSCLAGDVLGDYTFPEPLEIGQRLVFADMAHYTMVKTTTFNGVPLPAIVLYQPQKEPTHKVVKRFGYEHYRERL